MRDILPFETGWWTEIKGVDCKLFSFSLLKGSVRNVCLLQNLKAQVTLLWSSLDDESHTCCSYSFWMLGFTLVVGAVPTVSIFTSNCNPSQLLGAGWATGTKLAAESLLFPSFFIANLMCYNYTRSLSTLRQDRCEFIVQCSRKLGTLNSPPIPSFFMGEFMGQGDISQCWVVHVRRGGNTDKVKQLLYLFQCGCSQLCVPLILCNFLTGFWP